MKKPKNIDAYLSGIDEEQKILLEKLRKQVRAAAPEAIELISYSMPAFKYEGKLMAGFAAFTNHCSFFLMRGLTGKDAKLLKGFETTRSAIHFTKEKPLKALLVKKLVKLRMKEIDR